MIRILNSCIRTLISLALLAFCFTAVEIPAHCQGLFGKPGGTLVDSKAGANSGPEDIAVADLTGSGKVSLVTALQHYNGATGWVSIAVPGSLSTPLIYNTGGRGAVSAAVADLNGDGKPDIVVANFGCNFAGCVASTVGILLGNGDGTFQAARSYRLAAGQVGQVAIADLNNDGKPDLVATAGTSLVVFLGKGDGTFKAARSFPIGLKGSFIGKLPLALADMDGDGRLDAVVSGDNYVHVLIGNGLGQFGAATSYYSGSSDANVSSVAVADLNGDGKPDVAVANYPDSIVGVFLNSGNGTLLPVVNHDIAEPFAWAVAISDLNGDLKPDLVVAATGATASVLLGNGDGTFQAPTTFPSGGFSAQSITVADLNADRRPDLVFSDGGSFADTLLHTAAIPLMATTVTLKSSQNPSVLGQPVTFSGAVAAGSGHPPDGELITFKAGTQILGIAPLHAGVASLTVTSLSAGHHSLTAHYPGDSDFLRPSTSPSINQLVESQ